MWTRPLPPPLLVLLAASLLAASFQPLNLGPVLGWIVLLPLLASLRGQRRSRAFTLGWLFGLLINLSLFTIVLPIPSLHLYQVLLLCAYLACYPAAWCTLMAGTALTSPRLPWLGASLWVLLDYAKANAGFMAFPIGSLAQTQVDNAWLLQTASLFGEAGVTFLVVLGNLMLWRARRGARGVETAWAVLPIALALIFGALTIYRSDSSTRPRLPVAVLHTEFSAFGRAHMPTTERMAATANFLHRSWPDGAKLVVLPESSFINPSAAPGLLAALQAQADSRDITLVVGVAQALKFDRPPGTATDITRKVRAGAWVFERDQQIRRYDKVHRLAFAEYLPASGWIHWPTWLVAPPIEVIETPHARAYPTRTNGTLGIMVCWESAFASHARSLARQDAAILLQLSNEGWFIDTAAGLRHNATVRLRAVETQRPVLASVNAGPSIIVDRFGRVIASGSSRSTMEWVTATIEPRSTLSLYTRIGDLFVALCGFAVLTGWIFRRHPTSPRGPYQRMDLP